MLQRRNYLIIFWSAEHQKVVQTPNRIYSKVTPSEILSRCYIFYQLKDKGTSKFSHEKPKPSNLWHKMT